MMKPCRPGGEEMNKEDMTKILYEHQKWLDSDGKEGIRARLSGESLGHLDLTGANLRKADLSNAHLENADMRGANLGRALLRKAHLEKAKLDGAILDRASLVQAQLSEASLRKASLFQTRLVRADLSGANLVGADLSKAILSRSKMSGALLQRATLHKAKLRSADLSGADLVDSFLTRADLSKANLSGADLSRATLVRARLIGTRLVRANLSKTVFHEARLRDAILKEGVEEAVGIQESQFAGADMSNAKLPVSVKSFSGLKQAENIIKQASVVFVALLAACQYCWLTVGSTTDLQLVLDSGSTSLPIIQATVPITAFYLVAPIVLLGTYTYFHMYLQNLWTVLADLPAILPDGMPLDRHVFPWLLVSLARAHIRLIRKDRPVYSGLQVLVSVLGTWVLVPSTIFLLWIRYLAIHEILGTVLLLVFMAISFYLGIHWYSETVRRLSGSSFHASGEDELMRGTGSGKFTLLPSSHNLLLGLAGLLMIGCAAFSGYVIAGDLERDDLFRFQPRSAKEAPKGIPRMAKRMFGELTCLDLEYQDLSKREDGEEKQSQTEHPPKNRSDQATDTKGAPNGNDPPLPRAFSAIGPNLDRVNFRFANLTQTFLAGSSLHDADLRYCMLSSADLRKVQFWGTKLQWGILRDANLQGADLWHAHLEKADLTNTNLRGAKLVEAQFNRAELVNADLRGADLKNAKLRGANLTVANLHGCDIRGADFQDAKLDGAKLTEVNRPEARKSSDPQHEPMGEMNFLGADLKDARICGADLRNAGKNLEQKQVDETWCNESTDLPAGLNRNVCQEWFFREWEARRLHSGSSSQ